MKRRTPANESMITRSSLPRKLRDHKDDKTWSAFVSQYTGMIEAVVKSRRVPRHDVDLIVNSVIETVSGKINSFEYDRNKGSFASWLKWITWNRTTDYFRKSVVEAKRRAKPKGSSEDAPDHLDGLHDPDQDFTRVFDAEHAKFELDTLRDRVKARVPARKFQMYDAYVLKEKPVTEVVKLLGVTANQLYMVKNELTKIFEEERARFTREEDEQLEQATKVLRVRRTAARKA